jgi:hypothetical protein
MRAREAAVFLLSFLPAAVLACTRTAELRPAPSAAVVPGDEDAARTRIGDVGIEVDSDAWQDPEAIKRYVNPLLVTITNDSPDAVRVRYEDFVLVGEDGERYPALPPFEIKGSIERPVVADRYAPFARPDFMWDGFLVAPPYTTLYPTMRPFESPLFAEPGYYEHYYRYWTRASLPTPEMLAKAIPEGVLEAGGRLRGFLYFAKVDPKAKLVRFRADLVAARSGEMLGTASIPFIVDKGAMASR